VKDPRQRIRDIGDVRLALDGAFETAAPQPTPPAPPGARSAWSRMLPWSVATGLAVALTFVVALWAHWRMSAPVHQPLMEFEISPPEGNLVWVASDSSDTPVTVIVNWPLLLKK
jgi:hypothetical protein